MAMNIGSDSDEDEVVSTINTTPLVDVMLVLLIIFLITIPVVTHTVQLSLPTLGVDSALLGAAEVAFAAVLDDPLRDRVLLPR